EFRRVLFRSSFLPQCCQLVSHGNSLLLKRMVTPNCRCGLNNPHELLPLLCTTSIKATSSPLPLCEGKGAGAFLNEFPSLKMIPFRSPFRVVQSPSHFNSVPSSINGQPKLK